MAGSFGDLAGSGQMLMVRGGGEQMELGEAQRGRRANSRREQHRVDRQQKHMLKKKGKA